MKNKLIIPGLIFAATTSICGLSSCAKKGPIKIGMICINDERAAYDKNFLNAMDQIIKNNNKIQFEKITNISEEKPDDIRAALTTFAEQNYDIVISNSYGFENIALEVARKYPNTLFAQASGDLAHTAKLNNYCDGFASIYEGRYLAGIAAGEKLNELNKKTLGYVAAFPFAEVISGMTAFYLGARSVCPEATMLVKYTNSWADTVLEYKAASRLIDFGVEVLSQHADTYGAPTKCVEKLKYNVSYGLSIEKNFPETYLCYSAVNYEPWFQYLVDCVRFGAKPNYDYTTTLKDGGVIVGKVGKVSAPGTQEKIDAAKEKIINGELNVFDCSKFTVSKKQNTNSTFETDTVGHLTSYKVDIHVDPENQPETETIKNGVFKESYYRSAPYFDLIIDGITIID